MSAVDRFYEDHREVTRRWFLRVAAGGAASCGFVPWLRGAELPPECAKACAEAIKRLEYLTPLEKFGNVSRGTPRPYTLPDEKKQEVGLTRETWKLEVISDPDHPADLENPLTKEKGNALDWQGLMKLAETQSVSFPKIMTCNNIGRPLGMGFWEGVPLRAAVWAAKPRRNLRRVFYNGYHNDDPKQIFRSSLPVGRVLEDPLDLPPVILCYKLNGHWLNGERGAPVRVVVPEAYGFKSVKWLTHLVLSNLASANDTYEKGNNDLDSWLKTFAHSMTAPEQAKPNEPIPLTGYAQVGISGLSKVQTSLLPADAELAADDPYFTKIPWTDAHVLPPPSRRGRWSDRRNRRRLPLAACRCRSHEWPRDSAAGPVARACC
ncbi:MAG: molybdopterin-dependent oxidoreductase, partial [Planctomycetales bacterium]